jgi:hypothetical protein
MPSKVNFVNHRAKTKPSYRLFAHNEKFKYWLYLLNEYARSSHLNRTESLVENRPSA